MKIQSKNYISLWTKGIRILLVAILLNILAEYLDIKTWYGFLQSPTNSMSIIDAAFLFLLYPLSLGAAAK